MPDTAARDVLWYTLYTVTECICLLTSCVLDAIPRDVLWYTMVELICVLAGVPGHICKGCVVEHHG